MSCSAPGKRERGGKNCGENISRKAGSEVLQNRHYSHWLVESSAASRSSALVFKAYPATPVTTAISNPKNSDRIRSTFPNSLMARPPTQKAMPAIPNSSQEPARRNAFKTERVVAIPISLIAHCHPKPLSSNVVMQSSEDRSLRPKRKDQPQSKDPYPSTRAHQHKGFRTTHQREPLRRRTLHRKTLEMPRGRRHQQRVPHPSRTFVQSLDILYTLVPGHHSTLRRVGVGNADAMRL